MMDAKYSETQKQLIDLALQLEKLPLDEFLRRAKEAQAVGPILDPDLYRSGGIVLEKVIRLAEDAKQLVYGVQRLRTEAIRSGVECFRTSFGGSQ